MTATVRPEARDEAHRKPSRGTRTAPRSRIAALLAAATVLAVTTGPPAGAGPAPARGGGAAAADAPCGDPAITLEPVVQRFLDGLAAAHAPAVNTLAPAAARKELDKLQAGPVQMQPATVTNRSIAGGPTGHVRVTVVRPAGVSGKLPAIVYVHGGGWVLGDYGTHARLVRQLAHGARATVVFVDYTPAPEARYPVAIEQVYTAAKWVAEHGDAIDVDGSRLAIAGDSVGGNMAAAVTLLAKRRGGPRFAQQALFYPVTDANFDTATYRRFASGCWLTRASMEWFWGNYAPNAAARREVTASPLRATVDQLRGLPKALVLTDQADVLRAEGEAYALKLRAAGVPVTAVRYNGIVHDFMMLDALRDARATKAAIKRASDTLRAALSA
jgi:acetyl esterase